MLNAVLHAPLTFFELTPTGRSVSVVMMHVRILTLLDSILNLFSRDTYVVDMILARVWSSSLLCRFPSERCSQVIQNTVRTLAVTAMILVVIAYSFPLFVRDWFTCAWLGCCSCLLSLLLSLFLRGSTCKS